MELSIQNGLTAGFTEVEADQDADDPAHNEEQTNEVKLSNVLATSLPMVWVQVEEEEQDGEGDSSGRP